MIAFSYAILWNTVAVQKHSLLVIRAMSKEIRKYYDFQWTLLWFWKALCIFIGGIPLATRRETDTVVSTTTEDRTSISD